MEDKPKISRFSRIKNLLKGPKQNKPIPQNKPNKQLTPYQMMKKKKSKKELIKIIERMERMSLILYTIACGIVVGATYNYLFNDTSSKFERKVPTEIRRQIEKVNEGRRIDKYNDKEIIQEKKLLLDISKEMDVAKKALEDGNTKLCLNEIINAKGIASKIKILDQREVLAQILEVEKELGKILEENKK